MLAHYTSRLGSVLLAAGPSTSRRAPVPGSTGVRGRAARGVELDEEETDWMERQVNQPRVDRLNLCPLCLYV